MRRFLRSVPWLAVLFDGTADNETRRMASIVPTESVAGRALVIVIAIMALLASLTVGAVDLIRTAAQGWEGQVARELTIQIRPLPGRDTEQATRRAIEMARALPGVVEAYAYSREEISRLLEPWLGSGLNLEELPTPRLVVLRLAPGSAAPPDLAAFSTALAKEVPGATLDDHRAWLDRLKTVGRTLIGIGMATLVLVLAATALSVLFATRGAVAGNRDVVEVLHLVGARDGFVARAFSHRFLGIGIKGGALGGGVAMLVFLLLDWFSGRGSSEAEALLGHVSLRASGYGLILAVIVLVAALTAATSRATVLSHLHRLD